MKGYVVLAASVAIQVALGSVYAWSVFVPSLTAEYGLTQTQSQLIFGTTIAVFTVSMIFAGRLLKRKGPAFVACIGGVLFGAGYWTASFSGGAFLPLLLGIGVTVGVGTGFGYVCPIATCIQWFPNRKGMVGGLAVAGFGGGAVILSALASRLFAEGLSALAIFRVVGMAYGLVIVGASLFLSRPRTVGAAASEPRPLERHVLSDIRFWRLVTGMWAGTFGGLLVIGNLQPFGLAAGVSSALATTAVASFAVGNSLGRIGWGLLADRFGERVIPASLVFLGVSMALLLAPLPEDTLFVVIAFLIGFGFGACFVVYMTQTAHVFGIEHVAGIYPLIFLAYGFSGVAGPTVGGGLYDMTNNYFAAILVGSGVVLMGAIAQQLLSSRRGEPMDFSEHYYPKGETS